MRTLTFLVICLIASTSFGQQCSGPNCALQRAKNVVVAPVKAMAEFRETHSILERSPVVQPVVVQTQTTTTKYGTIGPIRSFFQRLRCR